MDVVHADLLILASYYIMKAIMDYNVQYTLWKYVKTEINLYPASAIGE